MIIRPLLLAWLVALAGVEVAAAATLGNPYEIESTPGQGSGPTLYVAGNGSDSAAGTANAPLATLEEAIARVQPGGTIIMRGGSYPGAVVNGGYGTASAWVTLRSEPGETVVLQGNPRGVIYPTLYFYHDSCDEYAPAGSICASAYWRVEGLTIRGPVGGSADSNAVKIDTQHVQIADSVLCCAVPDVVKIVRTANDAAILGNEIYADPAIVAPGNNSQGVDITGADRVRVVGNRFHDLPDIAVYAKGNARNAIFAANRIHNTGYRTDDIFNAIMLGQQTDENRLVDGPYESYDGLVVNNIISQVSGACIAASSSWYPTFAHNTCIDTALRGHSAMLISTEGGLGYTPNKGVAMINNIFVQSAARPRILNSTDREYTAPTQAPLTITANLYWARGAQPTFVWRPDYYNEHDFATWNAVYFNHYGATDASRILDPLLGPDFQPAADSPARTGALPGYARVDYLGRPRSLTVPTLGAIEFVPTAHAGPLATLRRGVSADVAVSGCGSIGSASFVAVPAGRPAGGRFPFGVLDLALGQCNGPATVTVTFPLSLNGASHYTLLAGAWSTYPAVISASSVSFTVADNGNADGNADSGSMRIMSALALPRRNDGALVPMLMQLETGH